MENPSNIHTCLYFRETRPLWTATQRQQQHVQCLVHAPSCVCACVFKIVLCGQKQQGADGFVKICVINTELCVYAHACARDCVHVRLRVCLCIRLPPFDSSRVSTKWQGWWWLHCCDLFHTPGCFPRSLHFSAAIYLAVRKRGITYICDSVPHPHTTEKHCLLSSCKRAGGKQLSNQVSENMQRRSKGRCSA